MAPKKSIESKSLEVGAQVILKDKLFNHWAFLDEIEAPMWVDLTSEAKHMSCDSDDGWFHISHPFHQCSSRQLISSFTHSGEVCTSSSFGVEEPSSPKVPSSVSRSRGKHYKSREWAEDNCRFTSKQNLKKLSSKPSRVNSKYVQEIKPGLGDEAAKTCGVSRSGLVFESNSIETAVSSYSETIPSLVNLKPSSDATVSKEGEKNPINTITSESSEGNQKRSLEVSTQNNSHTSRLFSALKVSLRKSVVTRPASRIDINRVRKSEGPKSSSSKSSVSSSSHPGNDGENKTTKVTLYRDNTPDSRNVMRISRAPEDKLESSVMSKAPLVRSQKVLNRSRQEVETIVRKSINQEKSKAKVEHLSVRAKVLVPHSINEQDQLIASRAKDKVRDDRRKRVPAADKENRSEIMAASKNPMTRHKVSGAMVHGQKATNGSMPVKNDVGKQVGAKENVKCRNGVKKSSKTTQKVYLR